MSTFTVSGTVYQDDLPFAGATLRATWTDGKVVTQGVSQVALYEAARNQARLRQYVGHPCGPYFKPDDWKEPLAFLWWCRWVLGPTARVEGGDWLPEPPAGDPGDVF